MPTSDGIWRHLHAFFRGKPSLRTYIYIYIYIYRVAQKERMVLISACDFFLWGYLKSKVYVRKPRTVDDLKVSIREEIATVPQEM